MIIRVRLNGVARAIDDEPHRTLLDVLRETLGVLDAKDGCSEGACGACTVLLDERPVSSCLVLVPLVDGRSVTTVRGLGTEAVPHPLQDAFVHHGAAQCGFCTPGMLLTAAWYLRAHPGADRESIRTAIAGNLCRCTGYTKIVDAVAACAGQEHDDAR